MDAEAKKYTPEIHPDDEQQARSTFIRLPRGADTKLFGGWGPKL